MAEEYSLQIDAERHNWDSCAHVEVCENGKCDICKKEGRVMTFCTCGGEYATLQMCISCINKTYEDGAKHNDALQSN